MSASICAAATGISFLCNQLHRIAAFEIPALSLALVIGSFEE